MPPIRKVTFIANGKAYTQEIPQRSANTRQLAVECKIDCPTAAKTFRLLLPWRIDP